LKKKQKGRVLIRLILGFNISLRKELDNISIS